MKEVVIPLICLSVIILRISPKFTRAMHGVMCYGVINTGSTLSLC